MEWKLDLLERKAGSEPSLEQAGSGTSSSSLEQWCAAEDWERGRSSKHLAVETVASCRVSRSVTGHGSGGTTRPVFFFFGHVWLPIKSRLHKKTNVCMEY